MSERVAHPAHPHRIALINGSLLIAAALLLGLATHSPAIRLLNDQVLYGALQIRSLTLTGWALGLTSVFSPIGTVIISIIVSAVIMLLTRSWRTGLYVALAVSGSGLITNLLKRLFNRERPPLADRLAVETNMSYPSGHSTGVASLLAATVFALMLVVHSRMRRRLVWAAACLLIVAVMLTRIYLAVHWFTDTIGGALIGIGTAIALSAMLPPLEPNAVPGPKGSLSPGRSGEPPAAPVASAHEE